MTNNIPEKAKILQQYIGILCEKENEKLGKYVAEKLRLKYLNVDSELGGFTSLVKQEILNDKLNKIKITEEHVDKIIQKVSDNLKQSIDYVLNIYNYDISKMHNLLVTGIEDRNQGLKLYWNNIASKLDEEQILLSKKYIDPLRHIETTIQMIQNIIEPLLRLDSYLIISAYVKKNKIKNNKSKRRLNFLLNDVYTEVFPSEYKKLIISMSSNIINSIDDIRIIRNAFKHGNYKIKDDICIITEKEMENKKISINELNWIFINLYNIRIFCRTVSGYIFDIAVAKYPEICCSTSQVHIKTVMADLNMHFLSYGLEIKLSDDYFCESMEIENTIFTAETSDKELFFVINIILDDLMDKSHNISIYIFAIMKCFERIFPYNGINKDDLLCVIILNFSLEDNEYKKYIFVSFDDIEEFKRLNLSRESMSKM